VQRLGLVLKQRLAGLKDRHPSVIAEVRGQGLMMGLKTHVPSADFIAAARDAKVILIGAGDNVARLLPPLIVTEDEIAEGIARLETACEAIESELKSLARRGAAV